jgi:hypothetical protein
MAEEILVIEIDKEKAQHFLNEMQEQSLRKPMCFILEGRNIVPCPFNEMNKFEEFLKSSDRIIKQENIGNLHISTVFLGINHAWEKEEECPILFETMVFKKISYSGLFQERYLSYDEAEQGHNKLKQKIKKWMRYEGKRATLRKFGAYSYDRLG